MFSVRINDSSTRSFRRKVRQRVCIYSSGVPILPTLGYRALEVPKEVWRCLVRGRNASDILVHIFRTPTSYITASSRTRARGPMHYSHCCRPSGMDVRTAALLFAPLLLLLLLLLCYLLLVVLRVSAGVPMVGSRGKDDAQGISFFFCSITALSWH